MLDDWPLFGHLLQSHAFKVSAPIPFDGLAPLHPFSESMLVRVSGMFARHVSAKLSTAPERISTKHANMPVASFGSDAFGYCTLHLLHLFSQLKVKHLLGSTHWIPWSEDDLFSLCIHLSPNEGDFIVILLILAFFLQCTSLKNRLSVSVLPLLKLLESISIITFKSNV